jgi:hypothetical protein
MINKDRLYHFKKVVGVSCPPDDHGCFDNASNFVADNEDLRYCEGLMIDPHTHIAFHHAWAVDLRKGISWEPTIPEEDVADDDYWGIALTKRQQNTRMRDELGSSYFYPDEMEELADILREQGVRIDVVAHAQYEEER